MSPSPPQAVLFACTMNRVRSPMAAALLQRRVGDRIYVDSCGVRLGEGEDPLVLAVMNERSIDLSSWRPKTFDSVGAGAFDLVICLSPEAWARAEGLARVQAVSLEQWPVQDPTLCEGSRAQRLDAYRQVREDLERRIQERFGFASASRSTSS